MGVVGKSTDLLGKVGGSLEEMGSCTTCIWANLGVLRRHKCSLFSTDNSSRFEEVLCRILGEHEGFSL